MERNLSTTTLTTLNLNFMYFIDKGARPVWGLFWDSQHQQGTAIPEALALRLLDAVSRLKPDPSTKGVKGILMTPQMPVLVAAQPILKTDMSGPERGTLIIGRLLDRMVIERLSTQADLSSMSLLPLHGVVLPLDFDAAKNLLITETDIVVKTQEPDTVNGYALLQDIDGRPAMIVKISQGRPLYRQGLTVVRCFIGFFGVTALAIMVIVILFLDRSILRPLNRMAHAVSSTDVASCMEQSEITGRKDEIGALGSAIDSFLAEIREQRQKLEVVNQRLKDDIEQRRQAEAALAQERDNLKQALAQVKTLSGLLPICVHCKQIRNDKGYWEKIEKYISQHSDASFSHSICPECLRRYYPEFNEH